MSPGRAIQPIGAAWGKLPPPEHPSRTACAGGMEEAQVWHLTLHPTLQSEPGAEPGHFGVCVDSLTSDKASVPIVLEKLLEHVELHGLYTEGLYRKSGAANRTRELRQALQTGGHCEPVP